MKRAAVLLEDCWYVAAVPDEIGETPLARTLLCEPVMLRRAGDGALAAPEGRCRHRHPPLSLGRVVGGGLRCGYRLPAERGTTQALS